MLKSELDNILKTQRKKTFYQNYNIIKLLLKIFTFYYIKIMNRTQFFQTD